MNTVEVPHKVTYLMRGFAQPWFIAGGWAIDLYLGRITRAHKDIEIAILRKDQLILHTYLQGWELKKIIPKTDGRVVIWNKNEKLELPVHEIHGHNTNCDPAHLEILLNESDGANWIFRRNPQITRPLSKIEYRTKESVPFLAPEIVLLYKSTYATQNDHADFHTVINVLGKECQNWLRQAIEKSYPKHEWLNRL